jgi:lipopolysaccharide assembly protein A
MGCGETVEMRWLYVAIVLLLATATLIFALQNLEIVSMDFLWLGMRAPLAFLVAATYVAGMATGSSFLALIRKSVRRSSGMSRLQLLISALIVVLLAALVLAIIEGWDLFGWRNSTS